MQALRDMKARLEANGVEVLGITDHHIFHSIYFFDPNGVRLELTAQLADEFQMLQESKTAHAAAGRVDRAQGAVAPGPRGRQGSAAAQAAAE